MGKKNNRKCCICGRSYSYCPTCGEDAGKPTWYFIFDDLNCHDIYEVCVAYSGNVFWMVKIARIYMKFVLPIETM